MKSLCSRKLVKESYFQNATPANTILFLTIRSYSNSDITAVLEDTPAPIQEKPEQHILNVYIPRALKEKYHEADRPPPLGVFAQLRLRSRGIFKSFSSGGLFLKNINHLKFW